MSTTSSTLSSHCSMNASTMASTAAATLLILSLTATLVSAANAAQHQPPFKLIYSILDKGLEYVAIGLSGASRHTINNTSFLSISCSTSTGPALVLLHGVTSKATDLSLLARCLKNSNKFSRIVSIDLQGHGDTPLPSGSVSFENMAKAVCETMDALNLPSSTVIVGNSLGGMLCCTIGRTGRRNPLYLISPGGAPTTKEELGNVSNSFAIKSQREGIAFFDLMSSKKRNYALRYFMAFGCRHRVNQSSVGRIFAALTDPSLGAELFNPNDKWTAPVGLFWGRDEKLLPDKNRVWFIEQLGHRLVAVDEPEGFGHVPHNDDPFYVSQRIGEFADKVANKS